MALRSLVRKMPALGARSWPTAPLVRPVDKLSPAACSRLMSTDLPSVKEGQIVYSSRAERVAAHQQKMDLMRAQYKQTMKEIHRNFDAIDERYRRDAEYFETFRQQHETIRKTCNAILLLCGAAALLTYLYSKRV